ncbi:hypothetical protein IKG20_03180 [Candidatus Saccharibacteria bacterium]|nr:hypothetical protein [Candidatus Saccharibacteria bacterium]
MPHFLIKKPKKFSINFEEIEDETALETPFWEIQRSEALQVLTTFYSSWQALWTGAKRSLGPVIISDSARRRLEYYESEQSKTVIKLLSASLVAWEKVDKAAFSNAVLELARELRPSLLHFETNENESFSLNSFQSEILKTYTQSIATTLKSSVAELQRLAWHKFEFGDKVITESNAESLIREKLGLSYFEFLDFKTEPEFNAHGFFPALLQDAADFGL